MGARGAWFPSLGLLGALALFGLPRASGDCSTLPTIPHAHPKESYDVDKTFGNGTTITYKCDPGYVKLPGKSDSITCQGVEWSKIPQFCDRSCDAPPRFSSMHLDNKFINTNYFPVNSTVTFVCRPGYVRGAGPLSITCQEDGTWSEASGICKKKSCRTPSAPDHGRFEVPTDILFGSSIKYYCEDGYRLIGQDTLYCEINGNQVVWSADIPFCEIISCGSPPEIPNGIHTGMNKDIFSYSEAVTYSCDSSPKDLSLIGEATLVCGENGDWNNPPPQCKVVRCKAPEVANAIQISLFRPFYNYKDKINFQCKDGFILKNNSIITCEADESWSPELPVCEGRVLPSSKEPPVSNHPGTTSQTEPPDSNQPEVPPSTKEPPSGSSAIGPGIIVLIVVIIVAGLLAIVIIYRLYKKKNKGKQARSPDSCAYKPC